MMLTFNNFSEYTAGTMIIGVDVYYSTQAAPIYSFEFDIEVIDCSTETISTSDPDNCPIAKNFPDFEETFEWSTFSYPN